MNKIKLFTHTDLDGVGCAILAKLAWLDNVDIEYCETSTIDDKVTDFILSGKFKEYVCVYITDLSVKEHVAAMINNYGKNATEFHIIDHHKTALWLNKYKFATVMVEDNIWNIPQSGTSLFYKHLWDEGVLAKNETMERVVHLIRRYDTWEWTDNVNKGIEDKLNNLLYYYRIGDFCDIMVNKIRDHVDDIITEQEYTILEVLAKERDKYIDRVEKRMTIDKVGDCTYGIVYASEHHSVLGNTLCNRHPEIDFVVLISMERGTYSFRSVKDNVDVAEIAKALGGGGHKAAAGCPIDKHLLDDNLRELKFSLMLAKAN